MFLGTGKARAGAAAGGSSGPPPSGAVGRLAPAAKSRLTSHGQHGVGAMSAAAELVGESMAGRGRSGASGQPSSPSELLVFDTTGGSSQSSSSRAGHYNRTLPEVPNIEEIMEFMRENWNERMARVRDPRNKLNVLWLGGEPKDDEDEEVGSG